MVLSTISQLRKNLPWFVIGWMVLDWITWSGTGQAQEKFDLASLSQGFGSDPYRIEATAESIDANRGKLKVVFDLDPEWHVFSVTQPAGGPLRTKISTKQAGIELGTPEADQAPESKTTDDFPGVIQEMHHGKIVWTVPFKSQNPFGSGSMLEFTIQGQVCADQCIPFNKKMKVSVSSAAANATSSAPPMPAASATAPPSNPPASAALSEPFRDPAGHVDWKVHVVRDPKVARKAVLRIQAHPEAPYHLYKMEPGTKETNFRTTLVIDQKDQLRFQMPSANPAHIAKDLGGTVYEIHEGDVVWDVPIECPPAVDAAKSKIAGLIGYQACTDDVCDQPLAIRFQGEIDWSASREVAMGLEAVPFRSVVSAPSRLTWVDPSDSTAKSTQGASEDALSASLKKQAEDSKAIPPLTMLQSFQAFGFAILGGLILNFMPCVLPVIGLKVLAFVEESEGSKKHVAWLNFWYVLGIMAVVMVLAGITITANHSSSQFIWGGQFSSQGFRIAIIVLVFSMALSFLGVWEIPIPGFATSKQSNDLASREGASGAFFKGVITTILATPCTGPFLGSALSFTLGQSDWIVLMVFFGIGLGIGLPFILIAAIPGTMAWLPKPGPWMDTLKQAMAFPLLFAVVFFLTTFSADYRIAAVTMLIGVWFACWLIGRVPAWEELDKRIRVWCVGVCSAAAVGVFAFAYLGPIEKRISWEPFNEKELVRHTSEGRPVLIDFTAEWCANCKTNLRVAIETDEVAELIRQKTVVAMIADLTDFSEEVQDKLRQLNCNGIPVLAVYPPGKASEPIVKQGILTQSMVLEAIRQASERNGRLVPVSAKSEKD